MAVRPSRFLPEIRFDVLRFRTYNQDPYLRHQITGMEKKRILYVEDNKDSYEMTEVLLSDYELTYARTKADAVRLVREGGFALILMDYWLSDGTGEETCRLIRGFDRTTPILFITASLGFTEIHADSVGAQGKLKKASPTFIEDLKNRIAELTGA